MAPEVPTGKTAAFLFVIGCKYGHQWFTYGEDESSHWGPAQCRYCLEPQRAVRVVKKLTPAEANSLKRYHVVLDARLALNSPIDARTEEDVHAQDIRETVTDWEFVVTGIPVQSFPKHWLIGEPVLKPKAYIVTVPVSFANPPRNRDAVHATLSTLPGWNSLEPVVGSTDLSSWELRLIVRAESEADAIKQGTNLHPRYFESLKQTGPALAGNITAVLQEDFLNRKQP